MEGMANSRKHQKSSLIEQAAQTQCFGHRDHLVSIADRYERWAGGGANFTFSNSIAREIGNQVSGVANQCTPTARAVFEDELVRIPRDLIAQEIRIEILHHPLRSVFGPVELGRMHDEGLYTIPLGEVQQQPKVSTKIIACNVCGSNFQMI